MKLEVRRRFTIFIALPLVFCLQSSHSPFSDSLPVEREIAQLASLDSATIPGFIEGSGQADLVGAYLAEPTSREACIAFFSSLTRSRESAVAILDNAEHYGVPPVLAFALAYEESRYDLQAINRNGDSVDRGLFQLNSRSFPGLQLADFYSAGTNARYGMAHLKYCLDMGGNTVTALAMYNAGTGSVTRGITPRRTLDYVSRITRYEENISRLFAERVASIVALRPRGLATAKEGGPVQALGIALGSALR